MLSIHNRNLITLLFLFGSISLANAQSGAKPQSAVSPGTSGWAYVQDNIATSCTGSLVTSCTIAVSNGNMFPTIAGTVWIVFINGGQNVTISSVTGGGGTWTLCPNCHIFNSTLGHNLDMAYNLSGSAGTTSVTVNYSGSANAQVDFIELLPPPGSTASFDASGTALTIGCTTCTAVGLPVTATDAIVQVSAGNSPAFWNSWSSPYITDEHSVGLGLSVSNGAAPTVGMSSSVGGMFTAIAFKSSAGIFTPPAAQFSAVNFTSPVGGINCNPTCSLTIPSTGSGHLLYIEAGNIVNSRIVSINGGGTWVIPSGANSCQISYVLAGNNALSCGYVLSSTPGASSLSITMSGSGAEAFAVWEISSASGSFSFDTQGSTANSASFNPSGQALTLKGTNDVIFQSIFCPGGISAVSFYPMPGIRSQGAQFFNNEAAQATLLNTASGAAPLWANESGTSTIVSGVAFMAAGGSTPPNPPTGLAAVVH